MATPGAVLDREPARADTARVPSWAAVVAVALASLPYWPLVIEHASRVLNRPHYEFLPLVPIAAAALAWHRLARSGGPTPNLAIGAPRAGLARVGPLVASSLLLLVAEWLYSPWLGMVAALGSIAGAIWVAGGRPLWRVVWPAWAVLWLMVPPPLGLDLRVAGRLQDLASVVSSRLLDGLGVRHVLEGNVIELPEGPILIDQACGGIQSLSLTLALTLIVCLWLERPWPKLAALCAYAVVAVLTFNVVRILGVALALAWWGIDLFRGSVHDLVGVVMFALVCLTMIAADRWGADGLARANPGREARSPRIAVPPWGLGTLATISLVGVGLSTISGATFWHERGLFGPRVTVAPDVDLPASWRDWRIQPAGRGTHSRPWLSYELLLWRCEAPGIRAVAALDAAGLPFHELTECYERDGWTVRDRRFHSEPDSSPWTELEMVRTAERTCGYVLFVGMDAGGRPPTSDPIEEAPWRLSRKIIRGGLRRPASYQVQILVESPEPLDGPGRRATQALFREMAGLISAQLARIEKASR